MFIICIFSSGIVAASCKQTYGWIEKVKVLPNIKLTAKLDTGAKTSSLFATNIVMVERDHKEWVNFKVPTKKRTYQLSRPLVGYSKIKLRKKKNIKHYNVAKRPVVNIDICIGNTKRTILVNLADRGNFNYPLLLGRRAIIQLDATVDPSIKFMAKLSC